MRSAGSNVLAWAVAVLLSIGGGAAQAESRAVVIANDVYDGLPGVADSDPAPAVAAFKANGFRVVEGYDLPSGEIRRALSDLLRADAQPGPRIVTLIGRFAHSANDSWFLGRDAGTETLTGVDAKGLSLSVVMDLMNGGQPHSVLLLGTDDRAFATGAGLRHSLGNLRVPEGVTVIVGYSRGISQAAAVLAQPGATVAQAVAVGPSLRLVGAPQDALPAPDPAAEDEEAAWQLATALGTAAAWREYLSKYPAGAHAAAARQHLGGASPPSLIARPHDITRPPDEEMAVWTRAKRTNTAAGYREFLGKYPDSIFAGAARGRMAELTAPVVADPAASAEAGLKLDRGQRAQIQRQLTLLTYDAGRIDGIFGPETRRAIARWQRNSGAAPTGYLTAPQIDLIRRSAAAKSKALESQARARQAAAEAADHAWWKETGQSGREADLRAYLQRYPSGLHAERARELLAAGRVDGEAAAWARASALNSATGYRDYLERFPKGSHAAQARQAIDAQSRRTGADAAAEAALDLNGAVLQAVEARLNQLGLKAGKADGRFDAQTRQALRRFQAARNLRVSGYLNQATLVRLLVDSLLPGD